MDTSPNQAQLAQAQAEIERLKQNLRDAQTENERALTMIRRETDGALDDSCLLEAVSILISQRDNARSLADTFRKKLKDLGQELI